MGPQTVPIRETIRGQPPWSGSRASRRCAGHNGLPKTPFPIGLLDVLLGDTLRKNGWPRTESACSTCWFAVWLADAARDALYAYVAENLLGKSGGVAVFDEKSFPKKGRHSAGVARQYSGMLGRICNRQAHRPIQPPSPKPQSTEGMMVGGVMEG